MGRSCHEIHEWIEENVEKTIEEWEERQEERCRKEKCKWWMLCLNKLFCWLVVITVKVFRVIVVTIGKWVTRIVCTVINVILDVVGLIVGLILSIPIIGGILRMILNWVTEIIWRLLGGLEFLGSLVGIRIRKKMYFGVIIPVRDDVPLMQETDIQPWVDTAIEIYDRTCNIDLRFTGFCQTRIATPSVPLTVDCGAGGFFADFWLDGSWFEFTSRLCKFESNWRRLIGKGSEISVFIIDGYTGNSVGCSMSGTHDYVTVQAAPGPFPDTVAHEIGHACLLWHTSTGGTNLMDTGGRSTPQPVLNRVQIATVRSSRHCTYI